MVHLSIGHPFRNAERCIIDKSPLNTRTFLSLKTALFNFTFLCFSMSELITLSLFRDVAKNAHLRWRVFIYWTFLGVFDAVVFFFGAYFLFDSSTVTSNGQVSIYFD